MVAETGGEHFQIAQAGMPLQPRALTLFLFGRIAHRAIQPPNHGHGQSRSRPQAATRLLHENQRHSNRRIGDAENDRVSEIVPEVVGWRRHIHANPELGFAEHATAAFVAAG